MFLYIIPKPNFINVLDCVRPPLWSSGQSSWLQIQRSGFNSRRYQIFWEVVGLERGPPSLVSTVEELLARKKGTSPLVFTSVAVTKGKVALCGSHCNMWSVSSQGATVLDDPWPLAWLPSICGFHSHFLTPSLPARSVPFGLCRVNFMQGFCSRNINHPTLITVTVSGSLCQS
jgi:hypothetical protein